MASFDGSYKYPAIYVCTFSFVFQNAFVTYFIYTDILSKPFGVMLLLMLNSYFNTNCHHKAVLAVYQHDLYLAVPLFVWLNHSHSYVQCYHILAYVIFALNLEKNI